MLKLIGRLFCHHEWIKRRKPIEGTDRYKLCVECINCGKESNGIEDGGFHYGGEAAGRQIAAA